MKLTVLLSAEEHARLKELARSEGRSMGSLVRRWVKEGGGAGASSPEVTEECDAECFDDECTKHVLRCADCGGSHATNEC